MIDKPIYNLRTLLYLITQDDARYIVPGGAIAAKTSVLVVDVSKWQGFIDFHQMKARGVSGVIIKCGQADYPDPKFAINWIAAKSAGLPRGTYFYFDSRVAPKVQAAKWAELIRWDAGELVHAADFEERYGGPYGGSRNFRIFLEEFQRLTGLPNDRIAIYTGYYYWIGNVPLSEMDWFGKYDLWLAWYAASQYVNIPRPWSQAKLLFWQFTDTGDGLGYGASSFELDLNYFVNGGIEDFNSRFSLNSIPPGGGTDMDDWKVTWSAGANVRPAPTTNNIPLATFANGAEFPVKAYYVPDGKTEAQERWGQLDTGNWVALVYNSQPRAVLLGTEPTPEPSPAHVVQVLVDGVEVYKLELP